MTRRVSTAQAGFIGTILGALLTVGGGALGQWWIQSLHGPRVISAEMDCLSHRTVKGGYINAGAGASFVNLVPLQGSGGAPPAGQSLSIIGNTAAFTFFLPEPEDYSPEVGCGSTLTSDGKVDDGRWASSNDLPRDPKTGAPESTSAARLKLYCLDPEESNPGNPALDVAGATGSARAVAGQSTSPVPSGTCYLSLRAAIDQCHHSLEVPTSPAALRQEYEQACTNAQHEHQLS